MDGGAALLCPTCSWYRRFSTLRSIPTSGGLVVYAFSFLADTSCQGASTFYSPDAAHSDFECFPVLLSFQTVPGNPASDRAFCILKCRKCLKLGFAFPAFFRNTKPHANAFVTRLPPHHRTAGRHRSALLRSLAGESMALPLSAPAAHICSLHKSCMLCSVIPLQHTVRGKKRGS